jgi:nitrogen fixation protein FixH
MKHWPGGDVMAIHLALYLATATVLMLAFNRDAGKRQTLHWAPVALVMFFVALSGLMAFFLSIATQGLPPGLAKTLLPDAGKRPVYTAFSGEVPHDEEAAKTISQYLKKAHQQKELGWHLTVDGLEELHLNETRQIVISVVDATNRPLDGASARLDLSRLGANKAEHQWQLQPIGPGRFQTQVTLSQGGQWMALISITRAQDQFETATEILVPTQ